MLGDLAVPVVAPRFRFEELCASPPVADDPRAYAVAARAVAGQPDGQWQVQAQIVHWRGETWRGGQLAGAAFDAAVAALRACQVTAPQFSPSITTAEPNRMAAVISGPVVARQFLLVDPRSSTISELVFSHNRGERAARGAVAGGTRRAGPGRDGGAAVRRLPGLVWVELAPPDQRQQAQSSEEPRVARVVVNVMPKAEILDPQGQAIVGALGRLGHAGISDVRQGKRFELEVDDSVDDEALAEIAESLLANTVIEDWTVSREPTEKPL